MYIRSVACRRLRFSLTPLQRVAMVHKQTVPAQGTGCFRILDIRSPFLVFCAKVMLSAEASLVFLSQATGVRFGVDLTVVDIQFSENA